MRSIGDGLARPNPCMGRLKLHHKVFVSFSFMNKYQAGMLKSAFEEQESKVTIFAATRSIEAGQTFTTAISRAIHGSDLLVLLHSRDADRSDWIADEVYIARNAGVHIVPFSLDGTRPGEKFEILLGGRQVYPVHDRHFSHKVGEIRSIIIDILYQQELSCYLLSGETEKPSPPRVRKPLLWLTRGISPWRR